MSLHFWYNDRMAPSLSKYSTLIFLFSFILGSYTPANAVQLNKLYSASVPVASQQKQERLAGFDQAFSVVLIKVSGQFDQVSQPEFIASLLPSEPYVQTFSYRENPAYQKFILENTTQDQLTQNERLDSESTEPESTNTESAESIDTEEVESVDAPLPYILDVSFASSIVEAKMADHGLAIWGSVRPSVLVWIAYEQDGERSIVGTSDSSELVDGLLHLGAQRGVPLYLPVADLQDVSAVDIDDVSVSYTHLTLPTKA